MGLTDMLDAWLSRGVIEIAAYECTACGGALGAGDLRCPECGGDAIERSREAVPVLWDLD